VSDRAVELFERFVEERQAGQRPDPIAFMSEAGDEADALSGMITAYLATSPRAALSVDEVIEFAARPELGPLGAWSDEPRPWWKLLPELRARRRTTRLQLIERLAEALGVKGSEYQVAGYVHELEAGLLSPARVRPAVVTALAEILAVPQALLEASRRLAPPAAPSAPMMQSFARSAPVPDHAIRIFGLDPRPDPRVDDLFTGGEDG
jgi:hypothetical protein